MMQQADQNPTEKTTMTDWTLVRLVIISILVGFGVVMLATSMAYVKDLDTLRNVPNMVWDFVCGRPIESGTTLPLLLTLGTLSLAGSLGVWLVGRWLRRAR